MSLPRYPRSRDSGYYWLGELPEHWSVRGLSGAFQMIGSGTTPKSDNSAYYDDGAIPWVNTGDLNDGELAHCERYVTQEALAAHTALRLYPPGSVAIAMYGATIGKVALLQFSATVNQACCVFAGRSDITPHFLTYTLLGLRAHIVSLAYGGGQPNISQQTLRGLRVPLPPAVEQSAIVAFLDRETGKIDALVEEQRRLIDLLKEKRQAVITKAVTKGLLPNVAMKPSGIDWLGDVPEHWEVRTVGAACSYLSYGFTNPMPTSDEGPYMLTANDIRDGYIDFDNARVTTLDAFQGLTGKSRPVAGDVLVTKDGTLGRVALYNGPVACINQSVALLRAETGMTPAFLALCLQGGVYQDRMVYEAGGTTIKHIYISRLAKMPLATPPLQEQVKICRHIDIVAQQFDQLANEARRAVGFLLERRAALITAAVTGKIDVRDTSTTETAAA